MPALPSCRRSVGPALGLLLVWSLLIAATGAVADASAKRRAPAPVPQGFVGVDIDGPLFTPDTPLDLNNQMASMVVNGVESVRVAFNWAAAQPYSSWARVPPDQRARFVVSEPRPTDFATTDQIVADAAKHGLSVLPTILYTPRWDARTNRGGFAIPRRVTPYAQYAAELVGRYGPHGTFWSENPGIPQHSIREWQIWNEPNLGVYWPQPFARGYTALLAAAHQAIKRADPGARIMLGAMTNFAWRGFAELYKVRGVRRLFDVASVNGFTATPADVILYLRLVRRALNHAGAGRTPLVATEISWPSAHGQSPQHNDFNTTESGQARDIAALLPMIRAQRSALGLAGFYYYTWIGHEYRGAPAFNFAGLLRLQNGKVVSKPALAAFRQQALTIEGCRAKGATAGACLR